MMCFVTVLYYNKNKDGFNFLKVKITTSEIEISVICLFLNFFPLVGSVCMDVVLGGWGERKRDRVTESEGEER